MKILGIDPGSVCGWALLDTERPEAVISGVWILTPPRGCSPGVRYLRLRSRLFDVLEAEKRVDLIAVEAAHHRGGAATEYAIGVVTHCQAWAAENGADLLQVRAAHVKQLATGKGNASKEEILRSAVSRWPGYTFYSDDEADARFIAFTAMQEVGCMPPSYKAKK